MIGPPRKIRRDRLGKRLLWAGWGLFILSMFLPAVWNEPESWFAGLYPGWECAGVAMRVFGEAIFALCRNNLSSSMSSYIQFASFAVTNLLVALAPLLLRSSKASGKRRFVVPALLILASLDVLSIIRVRPDWMVGYYVWIASYLVVTTGYILTTMGRNSKRTPAVFALMPRTPEERAAERELAIYLKFPAGRGE